MTADQLSRQRLSINSWKLNPVVFHQIALRWGTPNIDLFASDVDHQLPIFCSRTASPQAFASDALSISWKNVSAYAFPPLGLIPRVLSKIRIDQARVLMIAPFWPSRVWFTSLLALLTDVPRRLPDRQDLLLPHAGTSHHPDLRELHLVCWPLDGDEPRRQACLKGLPTSLPRHCARQPEDVMTPASIYLDNGAGITRQIPVLHL